MTTALLLLILCQSPPTSTAESSLVPVESPSQTDLLEAIPQHPGYVNILQVPAFSAGASHCEEDSKRPGYYKFKPEFLPRMGASYPRVLFDGHLLVYSHRDNCYYFSAHLASGDTDPLCKQVARWTEEQRFDTKVTTRRLILPTNAKRHP